MLEMMPCAENTTTQISILNVFSQNNCYHHKYMYEVNTDYWTLISTVKQKYKKDDCEIFSHNSYFFPHNCKFTSLQFSKKFGLSHDSDLFFRIELTSRNSDFSEKCKKSKNFLRFFIFYLRILSSHLTILTPFRILRTVFFFQLPYFAILFFLFNGRKSYHTVYSFRHQHEKINY